MAQTAIPCPQCGGQMIADIQQIFDTGVDPLDKERLLRGASNIAMCPSCGYQSRLAMPLVYHDGEKELFLTFFPPEMNTSLPEQEKIMGPLITKVVNSLPPEKKKGYLFQPRAMLTYETLIETILEADGITKEMLNEQKRKTDLLRRLLTVSEDSLKEIVHQEEGLIDQEFFALFNNVKQSAVQMRDQKSIEILKRVQDVLLTETEYGRQLKIRAGYTEQAIKDLQELGENLNRDSLLGLVLNSPDESYIQTLAGLARGGMDYEFFTKLSSFIDAAEEPEKSRYTEIRAQLLALTQEIDKALAEEKELRRKLMEEVLKQENMEQALIQVADAVDETFLEVAKEELDLARKSGDFMRSGKIQQMMDLITKLSTPPEEVGYLEQLLKAENEEALRALIAEHPELASDKMKELVKSILEEGKAQNSLVPEMQAKLEKVLEIFGN